jgi:uncharacterized repeat protein (TIGR02543 family)
MEQASRGFTILAGGYPPLIDPLHRLLSSQISILNFFFDMFRTMVLTLLAITAIVPGGLATTISGVDHPAVPVGETMTFTGSGFTSTSAVTFFWANQINSATFNVISDTELQAAFPNVSQNTRDRYVLVESPSGSALTMAGSVVEFTGTGTAPSIFPAPTQIIAKAGSVLQGFPGGVNVVYVESGAVLQNPPGSGGSLVIFAENGAVLDFRETTFSRFSPPLVLHSPTTTVLGSLPPPRNVAGGGSFASRQIPALSLHRDVGPFTLGVRIDVSVVGNGTAAVVPDVPFLRHSTNFTISATPAPGALFQGWSGSINGTNPVVTTSSGTSVKNIVATFTDGHTLETFAGSWGTITADPDLETYVPGQSIQLSANPAPGYQFVKWGGEIVGSAANPHSLLMDSSKVVTAVFAPVVPPMGPLVTSVDHPAVPVGETKTLSGSGFTGTSAVSYFWLPYVETAAFSEVSDSELQVTFPNVTQNIRDRFLLIESASGTTVTLGGEVFEVTGVVTPASPPADLQILAKAGSVLRGFHSSTRFVYIESGAVLQDVPAAAQTCVIFAEDGATLDLRGTTFSTSGPPRIIYSPGTTILGSLPAPTGGILGASNAPRQVASLSLSRDVGPFTLGVRVNLSVVGNGSAAVDPAGTFVRHSSEITLTATPESGWVFQGWTGSVNSPNPVVTTNSGTGDRNITATFTSGFTLTTYAGSWGAIVPDAVQETYAAGQQVELTATPAPGYQFVKWGGDLEGSHANPAIITMDSHRMVSAVFEPVTPLAETLITSVDPPAVPVGEILNFTGSGFTGATGVSFFWRPFINSADFVVLSDSEMQVTFPAVAQAIRDRFVLVEAATGSTVSMAGEITDFSGVGSPAAFPAPLQLVVKAGSVLNGIPPSTRVVFVESGAVLRQLPASSPSCVIFARDGSTLDLRGVTFSSSSPPLFLYGPGTTILGSLPGPAGGIFGQVVSRQIPSPSLSRDIGPFKEGYELVLNTEGLGTVTVDPVMDFYPRGTPITLTANPGQGNHFVRWAGGISGTTNPVTFAISSSTPVKARFSDRPDFFTNWRTQFFDEDELADPDISGLDADPDSDQITNAGEYAFGSNPTMRDSGRGIQILPGGSPHQAGNLRLVYVRPVNAADIDYILQASQVTGGGWFDGSSGDVTFEIVEESASAQGNEMEEITLRLNFTGEIPNSLFFRLTADIGDLP